VILKSPHKDWKIAALAVPDARAVGVDELLTQLWLRVAHDNRPTTTKREAYKRVAQIAALLENPRSTDFAGFEVGSEVADAWLRADLLHVLKRQPVEFSVARPLHLPATRLRNVAKAGDSGASGIVYAWLQDEAPDLLVELRAWLDLGTDNADSWRKEDLPSYALALLARDEVKDTEKGPPLDQPRPPCRHQGRRYVEDLRRLLAYRNFLPRAVVVEHMGRLTALHLGLYLLRTYATVVDLERSGNVACAYRSYDVGGMGDDPPPCPYDVELVLDCDEDATSPSARLAQASWAQQEDVLARYVRAHLTLKKLAEMAEDLAKRPIPTETLEDLAQVRERAPKGRLDERARDRIADLVSGNSGTDRAQLEEAKEEYGNLRLADFDAYMALLFQASERRWFNYLRFLLDSLFMKNEPGGLVRQPLGGRRYRRFAISPGMLETLSLIALVSETDKGAETRPIRLDQLIDRFDERYGLLVGRPPRALADDPRAVRAMAENQLALRRRLRESGLFVDLSDAFLGQSLKPRVEVRA
jgi:hypothetical protein